MFRRTFTYLLLVALAVGATPGSAVDARQDDHIIALERAALDRWGRGDPEGYLELYARDVTYFDPQRERRIDGLEAMRKALMPIKGMVKIDRYDMLAPKFSRSGDMALLTYNLVSHGRTTDGKPLTVRWNSSVVYARTDGRWKILHSHWSLTKPELKGPPVP
jgi:ketosteroid isomerase-like protein